MKITFSIIFITALSLLSATSATIYDSSGNKLLRGTSYYIVPLLRGSGGGLTVSSQSHKNACPLDITQEPFEVNNGVPFTFSPILLDAQVIREAYPVAIEADVINPCTGSTIWTVTTEKNHDHGWIDAFSDTRSEDIGGVLGLQCRLRVEAVVLRVYGGGGCTVVESVRWWRVYGGGRETVVVGVSWWRGDGGGG
ncbi:kunitz trypsin inhibitor 4 [Helianthus annuus]|uniref:kunitz trypsin inhibitor 4 n=1 Tax=Helianthus annuus TaxID=4232 RepID=UPI000B8F5CF5|nr:kunitz trypsin inhibitor 4 [Helianthus annuus]